jgi:hypothetical protein
VTNTDSSFDYKHITLWGEPIYCQEVRVLNMGVGHTHPTSFDADDEILLTFNVL